MSRYRAILGGVAVILVAVGCSARRSEPVSRPIALDAAETRGQLVFMRYCHQCHPHGEGGVGPSLNDKPLPAFMIRLQVRGGNGAMPPFDKQRISGDELTDLTDYLARMRLH